MVHGDVYKSLFALRDYHTNSEFRVIREGDAKLQAVLWSPKSSRTKGFIPVAKPADYDWLTYDLAFVNGGAPEFFRFGTEEQVMFEALVGARS